MKWKRYVRLKPRVKMWYGGWNPKIHSICPYDSKYFCPFRKARDCRTCERFPSWQSTLDTFKGV
ncbi:MAG: hypothetical protein QXP45_03320 [Thermoproteota archaeon]